MSRICGMANGCPWKIEQSTGGCPCAELCPIFTFDTTYKRTTTTTPQMERESFYALRLK